MSIELHDDCDVWVASPPEVEDMAPADLDDVAALEAACFSHPWPRDAFEYCLQADEVHSLVVRREGQVAAYLIAACRGREELIANLGVRPDCRRQGMARLLLEAALALGERLGMVYVVLDVRVSNAGAIRLYQSFGFKVVARRRGYYSAPTEDALVMTLGLKPAPSEKGE